RRAEARAARGARVVLAYSDRVADALAVPASFVPIAYPVPPESSAPVEEPVAAVLADWRWPPNRIALTRLLHLWPAVRERVPSARLLLAGKGLERMDASEGVRVLGFVPDSAEVLAQAAVVPFPIPDTSGPKVKVLEAIASGIPVVTTSAGIEGLVLPRGCGAIVATGARFVEELASLLQDPVHREALGRSGRRAVLAAHAPGPAARRRVAVLREALPDA
ncbi:MAG: glycosyltransferase family 4 protein, partial [Actinomycetota bacterium]